MAKDDLVLPDEEEEEENEKSEEFEYSENESDSDSDSSDSEGYEVREVILEEDDTEDEEDEYNDDEYIEVVDESEVPLHQTKITTQQTGKIVAEATSNPFIPAQRNNTSAVPGRRTVPAVNVVGTESVVPTVTRRQVPAVSTVSGPGTAVNPPTVTRRQVPITNITESAPAPSSQRTTTNVKEVPTVVRKPPVTTMEPVSIVRKPPVTTVETAPSVPGNRPQATTSTVSATSTVTNPRTRRSTRIGVETEGYEVPPGRASNRVTAVIDVSKVAKDLAINYRNDSKRIAKGSLQFADLWNAILIGYPNLSEQEAEALAKAILFRNSYGVTYNGFTSAVLNKLVNDLTG